MVRLPTLMKDLRAGGFGDLKFSVDENGTVEFDESVPEPTRIAIRALIAVHNPVTAAVIEAAEAARLTALDDQILSSATLTSLKAMTNAEFNAWWTVNVTTLAQANVVIKLLARVILRKVL